MGCLCPQRERHGSDKREKRDQEKLVLQRLSAEARFNEVLLRIPTRAFSNGASPMACLFTQQGRKGTNQDAMLVWENLASRVDTVLCGVFDGHGPFGHLVAQRVRDSLPSKLVSNWKARMRARALACGDDDELRNMGSGLEEEWKEEESSNNNNEKFLLETFQPWKQAFLKAFQSVDKELRTHPAIDCFCSGTTAVTLLLQGQDLIIGNVGDSRAILGTGQSGTSLEAVQLTVDLKPNLPKEEERIKKCKGRVFALQDEPEVARVWLPYDDSPGLAMARAFGDFCLKDFGLIAVPEITYHRISDNDQFIVLATDGVWDVLSNKEVVDIVSSAPTRQTAARAVVETAVRAWRLKYPTSKIDDCAVVCLYLHPAFKTTSATHTASENKNTVGKNEGLLDTSEPGKSNPVENTVAVELNTEIIDDTRPSEISKEEKATNRSPSQRSLADCLSVSEDDEWSALEGVTRVNSLLNLPRLLLGSKKGGGIAKPRL